ncbi:MAG TPA: thioredoxin family protein [Desulfuromonadaceae bacterium]|jgi:thioredoxin 1
MNLLLSILMCLVLSLTVIHDQVLAKSGLVDPVLKIAMGSGKPTLVEFGATWCPSCARVDPVIKALRKDKEFSSRVNIISVDVDKSPALATKYKIQSLPVLIFLDQSGKEIKRHFGFIEKEHLLKLFKTSLRSL